ncbi:MAG: hypothetical protein ACT4NY_09305, partial [Pseudonocardiales bacterium]
MTWGEGSYARPRIGQVLPAPDQARCEPSQGSQVADRFRAALELYEVGEHMLRQRLRHERPDASAQDIDAKI